MSYAKVQKQIPQKETCTSELVMVEGPLQHPFTCSEKNKQKIVGAITIGTVLGNLPDADEDGNVGALVSSDADDDRLTWYLGEINEEDIYIKK